jgi:putative phosphoribosyl transferase
MLAAHLRQQGAGSDAIVLALPRGGVPIGFEVAMALGAKLDVLPVRKLGVPGERELAMGAIAAGGALYVDHGTMQIARVTRAQFEAVLAEERIELARRVALYRGENALANVAGRIAIVVDDGMATGASMQAAVRSLREQQPARVIVGLPVAPLGVQANFGDRIDAFVCVTNPPNFHSVSQYYEDFRQMTDDEVCELLGRSRECKP